MAIADRDYMRAPPRGPGWLPDSWAVRVIVLIGATTLAQQLAAGWWGADLVRPLGVSGDAVLSGRIWTLATHALLHGSFSHVLWNLIGLWFFGRLCENALPGRVFGAFALWAAVAGGLGHVLGEAASVPAIGASGIVSACVAFAALRYPQTPVSLFLIPIRFPLWLLAVVWIGADLFGVGRGGGSIAHWAHLGGAAYGLLTHVFGVLPWAPGARQRRRRPATTHSGPERRDPDRLDERARVDNLLAKIGREGIGALTDEERKFLNEASQRYR